MDQTIFDNTDLSVVEWHTVPKLGDELKARQAYRRATQEGADEAKKAGQDGKSTRQSKHLIRKLRTERRDEYRVAARANRRLATTLRAQGLSEEADRFALRAQVLRRKFAWYDRNLGLYLYLSFLAVLSGYGYRPRNSLISYVLAILTFAAVYFALGQSLLGNPPMVKLALTPLQAIVFSMTSFHGRGFFPGGPDREHTIVFQFDDPLVILAACEAVVGLFLEITFFATFTQRLFNK